MPEPIKISSHLRTYDVIFMDTLTDITDEVSLPGDFVIADPVVAKIIGSERLPGERLFLIEPAENRKTLDQVQELVQWLVEAGFRRGGRRALREQP